MSRNGLLLRGTIAINIVLLTGIAWWFASLVFPADTNASKEAVRMRNALIAEVGVRSDFDWTPNNIPVDFKEETGPIPSEIAQVVESLFGADVELSNFPKAVALARHLKIADPNSGPLSESTLLAYRDIVENGQGWCSDFTQVMQGLAHAANVPIREWGMAFDGFGGDGHAFTEIWSGDRGHWIFIDPFYSFYVRDRKTGEPLSVLDFRALLVTSHPLSELEVVPLSNRFAFPSADEAIEYYRRGTDQFYLWWGNNVFAYDANPLIATLQPHSSALAQGVGILVGLQPEIRIFPTTGNARWIERLEQMRAMFWIMSVTGLVLLISACLQIHLYLRERQWRLMQATRRRHVA